MERKIKSWMSSTNCQCLPMFLKKKKLLEMAKFSLGAKKKKNRARFAPFVRTTCFGGITNVFFKKRYRVFVTGIVRDVQLLKYSSFNTVLNIIYCKIIKIILKILSCGALKIIKIFACGALKIIKFSLAVP